MDDGQGRPRRPAHHPPEARRQPAEQSDLSTDARLLGVDHVRLAMPAGAHAEAEADRFYGQVLGLRRLHQPPAGPGRLDGAAAGCWFAGPSLRIHLRVDEPFHPAGDTGPALLVDRVDALVARIVAAGGEVCTPRDGAAGGLLARVRDPFGNAIDLVGTDGPTPEDFRTVAEHALYPITLIDAEGTIRWVSASVERFFGWDPAAMVGQRFDVSVAPGSLARVYEAFSLIDEAFEITPWGGVGLPVDLMHADGHPVACELAVLTTIRTGLPWYVVHVRRVGYERALDLALEAMAEAAPLGEVLARLAGALEHMVPESVAAIGARWSGSSFAVIAGSRGPLLTPEPGAPWMRALQLGKEVAVDRSEMSGPVAALAHAEGFEACWVLPVAVASEPTPSAAIVLWRTCAGRPSRFTWATVQRVGQLLRLTLQWDQSHSTLQFAATHDPLTGLANRQAFLDRLEAVSPGGENEAAVLYVDLDHFKPVNEHLGHPVGDRVLTVVAGRLLDVLRPGDLVARMGGDEFAVLCERLASPDAVEAVAARLLEAVREPIHPFPGSGYEVCLDASIGVAPVGDEPIEGVLAQADEAMRAAKTAGRGRWVRAQLSGVSQSESAYARTPESAASSRSSRSSLSPE